MSSPWASAPLHVMHRVGFGRLRHQHMHLHVHIRNQCASSRMPSNTRWWWITKVICDAYLYLWYYVWDSNLHAPFYAFTLCDFGQSQYTKHHEQHMFPWNHFDEKQHFEIKCILWRTKRFDMWNVHMDTRRVLHRLPKCNFACMCDHDAWSLQYKMITQLIQHMLMDTRSLVCAMGVVDAHVNIWHRQRSHAVVLNIQ